MIFIQGKKVLLRGLTEQDLTGNYISWLNDAEVCFHNNHYRFPYSHEQAKNYILSTYNDKNNMVLAICDHETELHIGNISLQKIDWVNRNAEYAILLGDKNFWGKGYATEASKLIINHGFNELNLARIYCGTSSENKGMQKLALTMGMTQEGERKSAIYKHGKYIDILEYGLVNPDL